MLRIAEATSTEFPISMSNIDILLTKALAAAALLLLSAVPAPAQNPPQTEARPPRVVLTGRETQLHQAARAGDLSLLQARLQQGISPDARDPNGRTPLLEAAAAGQITAMELLLAKGARVNLSSPDGETPLIAAARRGNLDALQLLLDSGADLNRRSRGYGTALEAAERLGHSEAAALLRRAGARTFGRSVGDSVCIRPWNGEGYCGSVQAIDKNNYQIRVTKIAGCEDGCEPKPGCSAGRRVGGPNGLGSGDVVRIPSWCITHTDVKP
jgi:ankyrin repeat protein